MHDTHCNIYYGTSMQLINMVVVWFNLIATKIIDYFLGAYIHSSDNYESPQLLISVPHPHCQLNKP